MVVDDLIFINEIRKTVQIQLVTNDVEELRVILKNVKKVTAVDITKNSFFVHLVWRISLINVIKQTAHLKQVQRGESSEKLRTFFALNRANEH